MPVLLSARYWDCPSEHPGAMLLQSEARAHKELEALSVQIQVPVSFVAGEGPARISVRTSAGDLSPTSKRTGTSENQVTPLA